MWVGVSAGVWQDPLPRRVRQSETFKSWGSSHERVQRHTGHANNPSVHATAFQGMSHHRAQMRRQQGPRHMLEGRSPLVVLRTACQRHQLKPRTLSQRSAAEPSARTYTVQRREFAWGMTCARSRMRQRASP